MKSMTLDEAQANENHDASKTWEDPREWDGLEPPEDGLTEAELAGCPHPASQAWIDFQERLDYLDEKHYAESL